jgi:hypothetical protein
LIAPDAKWVREAPLSLKRSRSSFVGIAQGNNVATIQRKLAIAVLFGLYLLAMQRGRVGVADTNQKSGKFQ